MRPNDSLLTKMGQCSCCLMPLLLFLPRSTLCWQRLCGAYTLLVRFLCCCGVASTRGRRNATVVAWLAAIQLRRASIGHVPHSTSTLQPPRVGTVKVGFKCSLDTLKFFALLRSLPWCTQSSLSNAAVTLALPFAYTVPQGLP